MTEGLMKLRQSLMFGATLTFSDLEKDKNSYTPAEFVRKFKPSVISLESDIQTKKRWDKGDPISFLKTLYYNHYDGVITLCHIDSCIEKAIKDDNKNDLKYFISLKNMGKLYISCDGNHRSQVLWKYDQDNDITIFKHCNFEVIILKYLSCEEIHEYTALTNKQKSWNRQESRNAVISPVNDLVRNLTFEYNEIPKLLNFDTNRYKDREFFISLLFILDNRYKSIIKGFNQNALDNILYIKLSPLIYTNIRPILNLWMIVIKSYNQKTSKKIHKMFWILLYMICDQVLSNSTKELDNEYYE